MENKKNIIIDENLNLTNKELFDLPIEIQKEIFKNLKTNTFVCFAETHPNFKYPFEIDCFPCIINGYILY